MKWLSRVRSSWQTTGYTTSMRSNGNTRSYEARDHTISKPGITTTLIARTSILTIANPLYGRCNPKVSPVENTNLPAALPSRFDFLFLLLDKPSRDDDERLAQHVTHVHMYNGHLDFEYEPLKPALMRIHRPRPPVSHCCPSRRVIYIVDSYVRLRKQSKDDVQRDRSHTYTSTLRLMAASKESPHDEDRDDADARDADRSDTSRVYTKDMAQAAVGASTRRALRERPRRLGRGPDHERDVQDEEGEGGGPVDVLSIVNIRARVIY
ncbi:MCM2/3/5 family-domain-containing protein [Lactarius sanguifluus]|nr:MCM2/3/5 family-domain-containing protein [Lactarius sanguifluus]